MKSEAKLAKNAKIIKMLSLFLGIILFIFTIMFNAIVIFANILPAKYLVLSMGLEVVTLIFLEYLLFKKDMKYLVKVIIMVFSVIWIAFYFIGIFFINKNINFIDKIKTKNYVTGEYYVVVRKDSTISKISDIANKTVYTYNENTNLYNLAISKLNKAVTTNVNEVSSISDMANDLMNQKTDVIFINASKLEALYTAIDNFETTTKVVYKISVKAKSKVTIKSSDLEVSKQSFTLYISGMDSYGDIATNDRSDVNMLVTVNPTTHEVLLVSIPRDYYVQLDGTTGTKDKLTHAGFYGISSSINTIKNLMGVDIDYYLKVNFSTLVNVVDKLGGIDVYSDTSFRPNADTSLYIKQGTNHMNGAMALAFARERYAYADGDRHRVKNEQDVLMAIMNKMLTTTSLLSNYSSILDTVSSSLETNINYDNVASLIKYQIDKMPSWTIKTYSLNGTDDYQYTYTFGNQLLYVMEPDYTTVTKAATYINGIKNGKTFTEIGID